MRATSPAARGFNAGMAWLAALVLALVPQNDVLDARVAELLEDYPGSGDLDDLLAELEELGAEALGSISRALADDLRDGMAAAAAPALVDALAGHPDSLEPLRAALRDPAISPEGRREIARVLAELEGPRPPAAPVLVDEPRTSIVADPPRRESVRRKKTASPPPRHDTMAVALLLGGASIALVGLLLWTLRRKD